MFYEKKKKREKLVISKTSRVRWPCEKLYDIFFSSVSTSQKIKLMNKLKIFIIVKVCLYFVEKLNKKSSTWLNFDEIQIIIKK